MKAHVLQHVRFEDIGSIATWLSARDATVSYTRFHESTDLPDPSDIDLLIVMGGPMSVNDEATLPWLRPEKRFIREAVDRGIPVLGICLGAQLLASAMGSSVYRNAVKEIGWFPVEFTSAITSIGFPPTCQVFHWHGETFDLPSGANHLASSVACENQAFQLNGNAIGLQFHLEATPNGVQAMVEHCADELAPGPYIQTATQMRAASVDTYTEANRLMERVLSVLVASRAFLTSL